MNNQLNKNFSETTKDVNHNNEEISLSNRASQLITRMESVPLSRPIIFSPKSPV